jgi:hypothetical protein
VTGLFKIRTQAKSAEMVSPLALAQLPTTIPTIMPTTIPAITPTIIPTIAPIIEIKEIQPANILIIGDSMVMEGFGPVVANDLLAYSDFKVVRKGKFSTGLNRTDFFDWYKYSLELIEEYKPEAMVIMFGANDNQNILDGGGRAYTVGEAGWDEVYTQRVAQYMALISPMVEKVYWVGQPPAREAGFSGRLKHLNDIYEAEAKNWSNIKFISTWERFTVEGKYQASVANDQGLKQRVKTDDGIHLTIHGAKIMSEMVIGVIRQDLNLATR